MTDLLFTTEGELRERTRGAEMRVIARVVEGCEGSGPRLLCGAAVHEIVSLAPSGWAFELRDREGCRNGSFQPFRLRRGGRLRVGEVSVSLHGRPWSHEGWVFSASDGSRVDATVTASASEPSIPAGNSGSSAAVIPRAAFAIALEATAAAGVVAVPAEALALGCWLIARWHRTPAPDHVLASADPAAHSPLGPGKVLPAGVRPRAAS